MIKDLIKQYAVLLGSVLALALLAGACYLTYVVTDNHWSAKYSGLKQEYSDASAKATQEARIKEWEYQNNVDAIAQQGAKDLAQARSDADSANASIGRLQQRINRLLADTSSEDSGTTQKRQDSQRSPRSACQRARKNLSNETDSWLSTPTKPVVLDSPVKKPTTPSNQASNTKLVYFV